MIYRTQKITSRDVDATLARFVYDAATWLNNVYGRHFNNWDKFPIKKFADKDILLVCYRDNLPVGFLAATKYLSFFDPTVINIKVQLLYAKPGSRASKYLLEEIIDIGRRSANHVYISVGEHTNIKQSSLGRLGFNKVEEFYRLET